MSTPIALSQLFYIWDLIGSGNVLARFKARYNNTS
jgi:hypothetical protein